IYIALSIFIALYQLKLNGYYFQFFSHYNLKWTNNVNWTLGFLTQTFILLFPFSFFKPKKNTFIYKMLLGLIIINTSIAIFYLGALKYDDIKLFTKYTDILAFTTIPVLFIVSVWAIINKLTGSLFYFLGQFNFLLLAFYGALVNFGYFEPISNMGIIIPLGIILDVIFISLALFSKVKNIEKDKKENEQLLISQSRFTTMGQNIATLVHQWKNPISQLGSEILLLKAIHSLDKSKFENTFKETMPKIEDSIKFLNNTMNDIYNFYKNPNEKENFVIEKEIDSLLRLIDSKLVFNNIKIVKDCDEISNKGYKTSFLNIVLSILENSIYELSNKKSDNKKIFITLKDLEDNIMLLIEDNAGGIKSNDFDKLFTIDYSSKGTNGSGVGLALTKRLVESRLNGTITASNTKHGAVFKIIFPKGS
ncbi:sensor histidine kinase, partial [Arcobacter sp. CECT 8985]|uniref:sensor histidine kinase n=1 Tax=Arcobacter sp. CECT 8985 TaxID=1935424 RepID=UPI00100B1019